MSEEDALALNVEEAQQLALEVSLYPNPSNDVINVSWNDIKIKQFSGSWI